MAIEQVEPAKCTLWQFHGRIGDELSDEFCKELTTSMQLHGQRHPVLGRRLAPCDGVKIELIYGSRRLFAAKKLGAKLLVDVRDIDDRAAVVEMEIENRLRCDISAYERGMSYRRWLNARLFASQSDLATELGISEAQVSRLLRYAELPAAVVSAFESVRAIREEWAVVLAKACQDADRRPGVVRRGREISQAERRYPAQVVFRRLLGDVQLGGREAQRTRDEVLKNSSGMPICRIAVRSTSVHFIVPRDGLSERVVHELKRKFGQVLEDVTRSETRSRISLAESAPRTGASEGTSASA